MTTTPWVEDLFSLIFNFNFFFLFFLFL